MNDNDVVESLRALDEKAQQLVREALSRLLPARRGNRSEEAWRPEAQAILGVASPHHLTHRLVRRVERHNLTVQRGLSFKAFMVQDSESRRLGIESPNWMLDQKTAGYRFADELGLRRPETDLKSYAFDQLPLKAPAVIKPRRGTGSLGCYLVYSTREIVHVRDGARFQSWEQLSDHAATLMNPRKGRPLPNRWLIEELILEDRDQRVPARDLKFFCFYGEVLFSLEVRRSMGRAEYSFATVEGDEIRPGSWDYDYFQGAGVEEAYLELARAMSRQIPHPFMRVDMLKSHDGPVIGELTPRPGQYDRFNSDWDRRMGEAWARAEGRIRSDLLAGKSFAPYLRSVGVTRLAT